jgi:predicted peptidase
VLFLHNTSFVETDPYQSLSQEKGGIGWPYLVVMDEEGTVMVRNIEARAKNVAEFESIIAREVPAYKKMAAAAAGGESEAVHAFLRKRMELANISFADASAERKKLTDLEDSEAEKLDQDLINLQVDELFASIKERSQAAYAKAAPIAAKMVEEERIPVGEARTRNFWRLVEIYGRMTKDKDLQERAKKAIRAVER